MEIGMANRIRGELALKIEGEVYTLCLTLGALAKIETALGLQSLADLFTRLGEGKVSAGDISVILQAALMGGGHTTAALERLGYAEALSVVAELLEITFSPLMGDA